MATLFSSPSFFSIEDHFTFTHRLKIPNFPNSKPPTVSLQIPQVSLQDPNLTQNSSKQENEHYPDEKISPLFKTHNQDSSKEGIEEYPDGKMSSLFKSHIWVNPKSPRASHLKKNSQNSRYSFLVSVAESLNLCNPVKDDVFRVLGELGGRVVEQDAVIVLNNMSNADTAVFVLKWFQERLELSREVVLYNVTLKVFRKCKDLDKAESLFEEMVGRGIRPDNVTFSTMIGCARICSNASKAVEWFEKMTTFGVEPDDVTYSVMIDAYGRAGNVEMALSLYDRARTENWKIDAVTFATVIKIYGLSGNFDGCLNVYEEMKALGVRPNVVLYNTLLDAMGRAKRPWQVKTIYKEMLSNGLSPGWVTYAALLRAYGKARYGEDAMIVYRETKGKGHELNVVLYNTLLSMCADVGLADEAVEIYEDMKRSKTCQPDSWTFSSMVTMHSCCGNISKAEATLNEMLEAGFEPTIHVLTSLIQCYGKSNNTDEVVRTFDRILDLGISPDERCCGCLLNVMTQTPSEELNKLTKCIEKANSKLGNVVNILVGGGNIEGQLFRAEATELLESIGADVKKAYCNCLIDLSVNLDLMDRACDLLDLGLTLNIYSNIQSKSPTQWSLHLKSLSFGAALTALHVWMNDLDRAQKDGEELPSLLGINTGHGKHKYSDKGLAGVLCSHLKDLNAPFHEVAEKPGWFLTTKIAAESWLESRHANVVVSA